MRSTGLGIVGRVWYERIRCTEAIVRLMITVVRLRLLVRSNDSAVRCLYLGPQSWYVIGGPVN